MPCTCFGLVVAQLQSCAHLNTTSCSMSTTTLQGSTVDDKASMQSSHHPCNNTRKSLPAFKDSPAPPSAPPLPGQPPQTNQAAASATPVLLGVLALHTLSSTHTHKGMCRPACLPCNLTRPWRVSCALMHLSLHMCSELLPNARVKMSECAYEHAVGFCVGGVRLKILT